MKLRYARQAVSDIRAARSWWRANRPSAPKLLEEEIGAPVLDVSRRDIRRFLLQRTSYFLYYEVAEEARIVDVLRLWHASRGAVPKM